MNGTFDLLHAGHVYLLEQAKLMGDHLLVATDSDRRISEIKGQNRPIYSLQARLSLLRALRTVDQVEVFDSDQELHDIIQRYQPHVMVKGSDWQGKDVIGSEHCGSIRFIDRLEHYATSRTIQDILAGR